MPSYPVFHLLPHFVHRDSSSTPPAPPPSRIPFGGVSSHSSCCTPSIHFLGRHPRRMRGAANSAVPHPKATSPWSVRLLRGPPVPLLYFLFCSGPQPALNSNQQEGKLFLPRGDSELPKVFDYAFVPCHEVSARCRVLSTSHRPEHYPIGYSLLALPCHAPREEEPGLCAWYVCSTRKI